ncbi:hypothetical protein Tsubulata_020497 [Turnera subulata]|uniref:TPX2 central domain-containing protein n=1 Tax=Turnera subulata TaxID=218843 RepID=A0A9Q0G5H0_9ROSI|nr:hypothetical protein Tsubulata_020497 [Turnera subulata]
MEDEEMELEEEEEMVYEAREVDLDYEFDAAMFFDFTREESDAEAREAERWFHTAPSYPSSPFVTKLLFREENVSINSEENAVDTANHDGLGPEVCAVEAENRDCDGMYKEIYTNLQNYKLQNVSNQPQDLATAGFTFYSQTSINKPKHKMKHFPKSSTLMKPTASMLAKQNRLPYSGGSRFQMLLGQNERSLCSSSVVENQASKRQKLEGGHLRKVGDAKQQTDFMHKEPKKNGLVEKSSVHSKLRLTIPREPDLETANRAQRIRPKISTEQENVAPAPRRFKARPLNRKILEAPSLPLPKKSTPKLPEFHEFHLKTSERAMQHTASVLSSSHQSNESDKGLDKPNAVFVVESGNRDYRRTTTVDAPKQEAFGTPHVFKARPLNKKIFASKGELGVFRNSKREVTVPVGFNFHTEKRTQHNLPIDLFSKLSLTSELPPSSRPQLHSTHPTAISMKGSKENRLNPLQPEHKPTHLVKERTTVFGVKQIHCGSNGGNNEPGSQLSRRSLGIR